MTSTIIQQAKTRDNPSSLLGVPVFYPSNLYSYLYDTRDAVGEPTGRNLDVPLVMDTEYQSNLKAFPESSQETRTWLTTQVRSITSKASTVVYGNLQYTKRYPTTNYEFHGLDYLETLGHDIKIQELTGDDRKQLKGKPRLRFVVYAHFALAELFMIFEGGMKDYLKSAIVKKNIEMTRRLTLTSGKGSKKKHYLPLPYLVTIDGIDHALYVSVIDTGAIHGIAGYKEFCQNVGLELTAKDNFTSEEKGQMARMLSERPEDFHEYAIGDLEVYNALSGNAEKFQTIYRRLGLSNFYTPPKLTMGATVKNLIEASIASKLGFEDMKSDGWKNLLASQITVGSAQYYRKFPLDTKALAAKVEGGRCRNNRPTDTIVNGPLIDIDISGCYGEGQRVQSYPIGNPEVISWEAKKDRNEYWTLKNFLKKYDGDLVPGLWFARVSFKGQLKYAQDFFASWFLPSGYSEDILGKYIENAPSDTEQTEFDEPYEFNEEDGNLKIFNHEIHNATLTHDGLQWILNIASSRQRKELLEGLQIKTAVVYPKRWQVDTRDQLEDAYKNHKITNKVHRKTSRKNTTLTSEDNNCHAWLAINLGELFIDDLLFNRKQFPKKTPLNNLFKLCVNTSYGDMTSKFFQSANTCVGNNITARARSLAWYMEKGFNGFQTITDGCAFELNRVVYPRNNKRLSPTDLVNLYDNLTCPNLSVRPLDNAESISCDWDTKGTPTLTINYKGETKTIQGWYQIQSWVDKVAMRHLQNIFPNVDVLHSKSTSIKPVPYDTQGNKCDAKEATKNPNSYRWEKEYTERSGQFEFESKDIYESAIFHGTSNYVLKNPNGQNLKMRSYETKKPHISVINGDQGLEISELYDSKSNPANRLMQFLENDHHKVTRQQPFVKEGILKVGDWRQRLEHYSGQLPGDTIRKSGLLRELSLSQFTFKSWEQWKAWDKLYTNRKNPDRYGQSFEALFTNDDGSLDYQTMIETIDLIIRKQPLDSESFNPSPYFKDYHNIKRNLENKGLGLEHPHLAAFRLLKEKLSEQPN